jgi:hypothetical protein
LDEDKEEWKTQDYIRQAPQTPTNNSNLAGTFSLKPTLPTLKLNVPLALHSQNIF